EATVAGQVAFAAAAQKTVPGFLTQFCSYGLGSTPGFYIDMPQLYSLGGQPRIDYWPGLVRQADLHHQAHLPHGHVLDIAPPPDTVVFTGQPETPSSASASFGPTATVPFGQVVYARTR